MSMQDMVAEELYTYAMGLFFKAGHVATLKPEYINHSPEQFMYFDNRTDVVLTREQRGMFKAFNNVSRLFTVNQCAFFSINLLTTKTNRSQAAHDIHTMIHPIIKANGTICLFRCDDEVMLTFEGYGYRCFLSDWYPMEDDLDHLLERLDISNMSIDSGADYFLDIVFSLARNYYLYSSPSIYEILPIDFISSAGVDGIDREAIDEYVQYVLMTPLREYGDDYIEYDESITTKTRSMDVDLDLMLLEMANEDDNPFGDELESEDDSYGEDEYDDYDNSSDERDEYEFDDVDPEIFRDPTLMVKWLKKQDE